MPAPKVYIEDTQHRMKRIRLDDATYTQAIAAFVIVCTDVCIVDRARRTLLLARRRVKPMQGIWWIGGRRFAGETPEDSIRRCFKRETGLELPTTLFEFVFMSEYLWKDREQEPQNAGSNNLCHTYAVELTAEERAQAIRSLERGEYDHNFGLQEFDRARLVAESVHQVIVDFYDAVFRD